MSTLLELAMLQNGGLDRMLENMSKEGIKTFIESSEMTARLVAKDPVAMAVAERANQFSKGYDNIAERQRFEAAQAKWDQEELPKLRQQFEATNAARQARGEAPLPNPGLKTYGERTEQQRVAAEAHATAVLSDHNTRMRQYVKDQNFDRAAKGQEPVPEWKDLSPADIVQPISDGNNFTHITKAGE